MYKYLSIHNTTSNLRQTNTIDVDMIINYKIKKIFLRFQLKT